MTAAVDAPLPKVRRLRRPSSLLAAGFLIALILLSFLAPLILHWGPYEQNLAFRNKPPSAEHWLGTDSFGRDTLARVLYGARISLSIAFLATTIGAALGITLGVVSGYLGGRIDALLAWIIDVLLSFPALITGIMVVVALGASYWTTVIAIGATLVARFARLARASTMGVRHRDYVDAIRTLGAPRWRVLSLHILPNISGEMVSIGIVWLAHAIITESSLSFLGLGVQPPQPSWGAMIKDAMATVTTAPWVALAPGAAIALSATAITILGDQLQARLDPRLRGTP